MKRFFLKLYLAFPLILYFVMTYIFLPVYLDPFNVFHYKNIRNNGVEPNKNYVKMRYILDNPGKFDSFLFGSSRVDHINVNSITGLKCYNMTYSSGLPREHFENIKVMLKKNIVPHTVLVGVDNIACFVLPEEHYNDPMRRPYPKKANNTFAYFGFLKQYLHRDLGNYVELNTSPSFREQFYENGGWAEAADPWENPLASTAPFRYGIDNAINDIQDIIDVCGKNGINLIIFTNPLHKITYLKSVEYGYIDFLARLSEITDYYNFSGINDVTTNNDNYLETSHYKNKVGALIIDTIFNGKTDPELLSQGFGCYVTGENRGEFIEQLRQQITGSASE